jgi:hypothetical protein
MASNPILNAVTKAVTPVVTIVGCIWAGLYLWRRSNRIDEIEDARLEEELALGGVPGDASFDIIDETTNPETGVTTITVETEHQYEDGDSGGLGWLLPDVFDDVVSASLAVDVAYAWRESYQCTLTIANRDANGTVLSYTKYGLVPPSANGAGFTQWGILAAGGAAWKRFVRSRKKREHNWSNEQYEVYEWAKRVGVRGVTRAKTNTTTREEFLDWEADVNAQFQSDNMLTYKGLIL